MGGLDLATFAQPVSGIFDVCVATLSRPSEGDAAETVRLSAQVIWHKSLRSLTRSD
ncbi:hypothetical protein [Paracoccus liaowanqingii]|uniref:hypothetical protein n=1 Tax=Paracoccus liaowanqingii TaxID=2560053 RepID=UPI00159BEC12|nr:hypothetical protein [Paracoccus liaowanqingii]